MEQEQEVSLVLHMTTLGSFALDLWTPRWIFCGQSLYVLLVFAARI
jgi:hypothetical protein